MQHSNKDWNSFKSEVVQAITEVKVSVKQEISDNNRHIQSLVRQEIQASERRLEQKIIDSAIRNRDEILSGVAEMIDSSLLPQIDDHEVRLTKLETKAA